MNRRWLKEIILTVPSFAWLLVFFVIPTCIVFAYAFKPSDIYGNVNPGWTMETIVNLANPAYISIFWRTLWLGTLTTFFCVALALPMGYYIARATSKARQIFLLLIVLPFWSSFLIRIFAWKSLLHPEGFVKQSLVYLHIISEETSLLYNSGAVLVVMVYSYLPFAVLPIFASAVKFNFQLYEAAMDLGATRLQAFFKVFIPGIRQSILTAMLMVFIPALGAYVIPDVVGGTQSEMIGNKIAQRIFIERNLPLASGLSVALCLGVMIPLAIIALIQARVGKYGIGTRGKQ